jgi:hypothetical protein
MDNRGDTPFYSAIIFVKGIMNAYYNTDPDILIANNSILHRFIRRGRDETIKHLFWLGLPVSYLERKDTNERTPLQVALNEPFPCEKTIILLLDLGADADPDVRHKYGSHTEGEVAAIRYDCFFSRSLASRLLPFCMISE